MQKNVVVIEGEDAPPEAVRPVVAMDIDFIILREKRTEAATRDVVSHYR